MRLRPRMVAGVAGAALLLAGIPAMAAGSAGKPTAEYSLLCGVSTGPTADNPSGNSGVIHPTGLSASGGSMNNGEYDSSTSAFSSGQCDQQQNNGASFTWAVRKANVRPNEQGTEHADATGTQLARSGSYAVTFNGRVSNYDFGDTPDQQGSREVYYQSGGPFNTEGGAQAGDHYRGTYSTVYYKDDNNNNCKTNSNNYCFEALLSGQVN